MKVTMMAVGGRIATVDIPEGSTVLDAAKAAKQCVPDQNWEGLVKDREVRVNNKKFSNSNSFDQSNFAGNIGETALHEGDVVVIVTAVTGNS